MRNAFLLLLVFCLGLPAIWAVDQWEVLHWQNARRIELQSTANALQLRLNNTIDNRFDSIAALAALFAIHPDTGPEDFAQFADMLLEFNPPIRAIQYADPQTRVVYVYPPKGNEVTIEKPMLLLADEKRGPFVRKAMEEHRAVLQGPFELRQGGMGAVVRQPIYAGDRFLGLAIGVFDLPVLVEEALSGLELERMDITLADGKGEVFWGSEALGPGAMAAQVEAADAQWTVSVDWKQGLGSSLPGDRIRIWLVGLCLLTLLALYLATLRTKGLRLRQLVAERTNDLSAANELLRKEAAERMAVVERLQESESRYRSLFEEAPLPILIADPETGRIQMLNQAFRDMLGYQAGEVEGMDIGELHPEEWRERIRTGFNAQMARGGGTAEALPCLTKQGGLLYASVHSAPVMLGGQKRVIGFFNDVTKRLQAEEALRDSEERMALALEAVNDAIWDWRVGNSEVFYSARWYTMLGYEPHELPQEFDTWRKLVHPEDLPTAEGAVMRHLESGEPFRIEFRMQRKDGGWAWINARGMAVEWDENGRPLRMLGTHQDISDRKQAEEALKESQTRFKALHDASFGGIAIHDQGLILDCNQGLSETTGYAREELIGMNGLLLIAEGSRDQVMDNIKAGYEQPYEVYGVRKNGEEYPLRLEARNIPYKGKLVRSVEFRDITSQRQAELALIEAKEHAEAANRAKSEFLANMSHEIRTPMNGVLGMLQLMLSTELNAEQKEYAAMALQSSMRLTRLLTDVLDLAKVEAGRLLIMAEPFDLPGLLTQVSELFRPTTVQAEVPLYMTIHDNVPRRVVGDSTRIQQVLANLIGNALKFTPKGSVSVEVYALPGTRPDSARILFSVSDTGIGIDDETLVTLFRPFTQASQGYRRDHQGAGLGLSICKRLVELMGGTLSVESEQGTGTTVHFSLSFPLAEGDASAPEAIAAEPGAAARSLSVLLAEDDRVSALAASRQLEKLGHGVRVVTDGAQALDALRKQAHDLVLMDVQMPVMDGVEATRRIRAGQAGENSRSVPIVAMTAYAMVGDKEKFLAAGMDDYLGKPVDIETMRRMLDRVLGRDLQ